MFNVKKRKDPAEIKELCEQIMELYAKGSSVKSCAREFNINKNSVKRILKLNNIPIRTQDNYQHIGKQIDTRLKEKIILEYKYTAITRPELRIKYEYSLWTERKLLKDVKKEFIKPKIFSSGYSEILNPDNDNGKFRVKEHRMVMQQKLGRPLDLDEYVHHINLDKFDNEPDNLIALDINSHANAHTSLYPITSSLIKLDIISFSNKTNTYSVSQDWVNWYQAEGQHLFNDRNTQILPKKKLHNNIPLFMVK